MDPQSPAKRRALASLDINAQSARSLSLSPIKGTLQHQRKRPQDEVSHSPSKKTCVDPSLDPVIPVSPSFQLSRDQSREASLSPPASASENSIFDTSAGDSSWATTATEPDIVPVVRRRVLTREQAREKVDILRARLGLASYKVRTGQMTVPLAELEKTALPKQRLMQVGVLSSIAVNREVVRRELPKVEPEKDEEAAEEEEEEEDRDDEGEEKNGDEAENRVLGEGDEPEQESPQKGEQEAGRESEPGECT